MCMTTYLWLKRPFFVLVLAGVFLTGCLPGQNTISRDKFSWEYKSPLPSYSRSGKYLSHSAAWFAEGNLYVLERLSDNSKPSRLQRKIRLKQLSSTGELLWQHVLFDWGKISYLERLFVIKSHDSKGRLLFGRYGYKYENKVRIGTLSVYEFEIASRSFVEIARHRLSKIEAVSSGWRRKDGLTVFAGKNSNAPKGLALLAFDGHGKLVWQLDEINIKGQQALRPRGVISAGFDADGNFRYLARKRPFEKDKAGKVQTRLDWAVYQHVLDENGKTVSAKSRFDWRRGDFSNAHVGLFSMNLAPKIRLLHEIDAGEFVFILKGWYRGRYAAVRLAKVDKLGNLAWVLPLLKVPGNDAATAGLVPSGHGDWFVIASQRDKKDKWQSFLFKVTADGELVWKRPFAAEFLVHDVLADPKGGFVLKLKSENKDKTTNESYAKIKTFEKME